MHKIKDIKVHTGKKLLLFYSLVFLCVLILPLATSYGFADNTKPSLRSPVTLGASANVNYSTVNVNNSQFLQGYTPFNLPYGNVSGTGIANQLCYWKNATTISNISRMTYDSSTGDILINGVTFNNETLGYTESVFGFGGQYLSASRILDTNATYTDWLRTNVDIFGRIRFGDHLVSENGAEIRGQNITADKIGINILNLTAVILPAHSSAVNGTIRRNLTDNCLYYGNNTAWSRMVC